MYVHICTVMYIYTVCLSMYDTTHICTLCVWFYVQSIVANVYTVLYNILNCICTVFFALFSTIFVPCGVFRMAFDRVSIAIPGSI